MGGGDGGGVSASLRAAASLAFWAVIALNRASAASSEPELDLPAQAGSRARLRLETAVIARIAKRVIFDLIITSQKQVRGCSQLATSYLIVICHRCTMTTVFCFR